MPFTLLKLHETATILRVSQDRVAQLARLGILPVVHLGRQVRVNSESLQEFIRAGGRALPGGWRKRKPVTGNQEAAIEDCLK
jgi:excisionase family DNA binding protein